MLSKLQEIKNNHEEGFTLIELLVVILIIGILAAVAVPMFLNNRKSGVDSTVTSDVKNASTQVEAWITKQGAAQTNIPTAADKTAVQALTGKDEILKDIKVSEGTELTVVGTSYGYCVQGKNTSGAEAAKTNGFTYESSKGKLSTDACTTTGGGTLTLTAATLAKP